MQKTGVVTEDKKLFKVDIHQRHKDFKEVAKKITASKLQEQLKCILADKELKILEVRFVVESNNAMLKFEEKFKNKAQLKVEPEFNRIQGNKFLDYIFSDLRHLQKKTGRITQFEAELNQKMLNKEFEENREIEKKLELLMSVYRGEACKPISNKLAQEELSNEEQKLRINMIILSHKNVYESLNNQKVIVKTNGGDLQMYLHTQQNSKQIDNIQVNKIKKKTGVSICRVGTLDSTQTQFWAYFDIKKLEERLNDSNKSIGSLVTYIMRENLQEIKKFDIYVSLFQSMVMKMEINMIQIKHVVKTRSGSAECYYLVLKHPARYYLYLLNTFLIQEPEFIKEWKRVENFTTLRNDRIKENDFLRLHLFNNSVIELVFQNEHGQSKKFIDNLCQKYNIEVRTKDNISRQPFDIFVENIEQATSKFSKHLNMTGIDRSVVWKIKYYILCLLSKGLYNVTEVNLLIDLIKENENYTHIFLNLFEKMCLLESKWSYKDFNKHFTDEKMWPKHLTKSYSQPSGLAVYVFRVSITPSGYIYSNKSPEMQNRLLRQYSEYMEQFFRCTVIDDNGDTLKNSSYITRKVFRRLLDYYFVAGRKFIPLGWSPSQLRGFSLWYINESEELKRSQVLNFLGEFTKIQPYAKMAARIGQAFSSSWCYFIKGKLNVLQIPDIYTLDGKKNFTDGIGKISQNLIDQIALQLKIPDLSVIQIRYKGCKGLLVLDPRLPENTICVRPSMQKYKSNHDNSSKYLDILSWNMFKGGYLNRQIIILLKTRGISDETFLKLQDSYIDEIKRLTFQECTVFRQLINPELDETLYALEPANKIIRNLCQSGFRLDSEPFFRGVLEILKRNGYQKLRQKSNINVKKSVRLVGIIDQYGLLQEGEMYCRYLNIDEVASEGDGNPYKKLQPKTVSSSVVVVRNPCLHPGDIRKQRCVPDETIIERANQRGIVIPRLKHPFVPYVNTVIFSQKGDMPVTCQISGSDLDGDNFFVCWDQQLTSIDDYPPYVIEDKKAQAKKIDKNDIGVREYDEMLNFFVDYMNYQKLGKIANSHLVKADQDTTNFAKAADCIKLAEAHGNAVDFPKTGYCPQIDQTLFVKEYPDFMEKDDKFKTYPSQSILGVLYREIKKKSEDLFQKYADEKGVNVQLDGDLCNLNQKLAFKEQDIEQALKILYDFNQDIGGIIFLYELSNEFQIYTGNITSSKIKVMRQCKPIDQIVALKSSYMKLFFGTNPEMSHQEYFDVQFDKLKTAFSHDLQQKALLWYVLSYVEYEKFTDISYSKNPEALSSFKRTVESLKAKRGMPKEANKYFGLIWFTVPKILMAIKLNSAAKMIEVMKGKEGQTEVQKHSESRIHDDDQEID